MKEEITNQTAPLYTLLINDLMLTALENAQAQINYEIHQGSEDPRDWSLLEINVWEALDGEAMKLVHKVKAPAMKVENVLRAFKARRLVHYRLLKQPDIFANRYYYILHNQDQKPTE